MRTRRFAEGSAIGHCSFLVIGRGQVTQSRQEQVPVGHRRAYRHSGCHSQISEALTIVVGSCCGESPQLCERVSEDIAAAVAARD